MPHRGEGEQGQPTSEPYKPLNGGVGGVGSPLAAVAAIGVVPVASARSRVADSGVRMHTERIGSEGSSALRYESESRSELQAGESASLLPSHDPLERRAKRLGWFSVGLGLAQVLTPRNVAWLSGIRPTPGVRGAMIALGIREIATGVGLLTQRRPAGWLWLRVAGDLMDLALLGGAMKSPGAKRPRLLGATAAVLGVTVADTAAALQLSRRERDQLGKVHVIQAVTINRPREDVYRFWRDFQNLPRFMSHLEYVEVIDGYSRWRAKAPLGATVEWEAELFTDRPNDCIAWKSREGALVPNYGSVRFLTAPGGRGTELRVELHYEPPAGALGATIAKLFGEEPGQQIRGDLQRLKQVLETGEVLHSDASIHKGMHPGRPSGMQSGRGGLR